MQKNNQPSIHELIAKVYRFIVVRRPDAVFNFIKDKFIKGFFLKYGYNLSHWSICPTFASAYEA